MIRWIVCPVVVADPDTRGLGRHPKVGDLIDPGTGFPFNYSTPDCAGNWCVCFVRGLDFTPIDLDVQCVDPFDGLTYECLTREHKELTATADSLGWPSAKQQRVRDWLANWGLTDLRGDTRLDDTLLRLIRKLHPQVTDIRNLWVTPYCRGMMPTVFLSGRP